MPSIGPEMPGMGGIDMMKAVNTIKEDKDNQQDNYDYNNDIYFPESGTSYA